MAIEYRLFVVDAAGNGKAYYLNNRVFSQAYDFALRAPIAGVSQRDVVYDEMDNVPGGTYRGERWRPYVITIPIQAFATSDTNLETVINDLLSLTDQGSRAYLTVYNGSKSATLDLQYLDMVMTADGVYTRDVAFRFLALTPFWHRDSRVGYNITPSKSAILGGGIIQYPLSVLPPSSVYSSISISAGSAVKAMARRPNVTYVAGSFTTIGSANTRVAKISYGPTVTAIGNNSGDGDVLAIDPGFGNDEILIGGTFTTLGGTSGRLLRWNGSAWTSLGYPTTVTEIRAIKTTTLDPIYYIWAGGSASGTDHRLYIYGGSWFVPTAGGVNTTGSVVQAIEAYRDRIFVGVQLSSSGVVYAYNATGSTRSTVTLSTPIPLGYPVRMRVYDDKLYIGWRAINPTDYSGIVVMDSVSTVREYIKLPGKNALSDFDIDKRGIYAVCDMSYTDLLSAVWIYDGARWKLIDIGPSVGNTATECVIAVDGTLLNVGTGLLQRLSNIGNIVTISNPGNVDAYPWIEITPTLYDFVEVAIINHTTRDYLHVAGRFYGKTVIVDCEKKRIFSLDDGNSFYNTLRFDSTLDFRLMPGNNYVSFYGSGTSVLLDFTPQATHYSRFVA